jgi:flavin reductase
MREAFVAAMGAAATGVTVVTTDGPAGRLGLTVSAMVSVSADPPTLLVCVHRRSPLEAALRANGRFAVSVLAEHQAALADRFAGRPVAGEPYGFDPAQWVTGPDGLPLAAGAAASFECDVASTVAGGSHTIAIGAVRSASRGAGRPLAYARRDYASLTALHRRAQRPGHAGTGRSHGPARAGAPG